MRGPAPLLLVLLLAARAAVAAEDPVTALVPEESPIVVRLPSLERMDELGREFAPLVAGLLGEEDRGRVARVPLSTLLMEEFGYTSELPFVRSRPVYLALAEGEPLLYLPAEPGAAPDDRDLGEGRIARLREGMLCLGPRKRVEARARGRAVALPPGDAVVHVFLAEIVERHRDALDAFFDELQEGCGDEDDPLFVRGAVKAIVGPMRDAVFGVASAEYALTWDGTRLHAEGTVRVHAGSRLRGFLGRAGAPAENDLARFLPRRALLHVDEAGADPWFGKELEALLAEALGPESAPAVRAILGAGILPLDHLAGRSASAVSVHPGGASATSVVELKDGARSREALRAFDAKAVNEALKALELPVAIAFTADAGKVGETPYHALTLEVTDPDAAMLGMMLPETLLAVEGSLLAVVVANAPLEELEELLERLRAGQGDAEHPHLAAMARLGRARHVGLTWNLGELKDVLALMLGAWGEDDGLWLTAVPDELFLSTSMAIRDGNLHWRGDWPVQELAKIAEALLRLERESRIERELPPPPLPPAPPVPPPPGD